MRLPARPAPWMRPWIRLERKDMTKSGSENRKRQKILKARFTDQEAALVKEQLTVRFNYDRHLNRRDIFKQNRSAALAEWRQPAA